MRAVLYVLAFLSVIALGFWAYRENYATQASLREVRGLQREISALREAMSVQKAEWAWLNRPERLRDLVNVNFERVPLMPMEPGQFGVAAQVSFPVPEIPAIDLPADAIEAAVSTAAGKGKAEGL